MVKTNKAAFYLNKFTIFLRTPAACASILNQIKDLKLQQIIKKTRHSFWE